MTNLTLFHTPGACSRVVLNALEEIGVAFDEVVIDLAKGEQRQPDRLRINPRGKVPALTVEGQLLTENASILLYLHEAYPQAGLFPPTSAPLEQAAQRSDLIWISTSLHPIVRMMFMPGRLSASSPQEVCAAATAQFKPLADEIEQKLSTSTWWFGSSWSIIDVFLTWAIGMAGLGGFDFSAYPAITAHVQKVRARPSFKAALAREQAAVDSGRATLPPGAKL